MGPSATAAAAPVAGFAAYIGPLSASQRDMQAQAANTSASTFSSLTPHTTTTTPVSAPARTTVARLVFLPVSKIADPALGSLGEKGQ